MVNFIFLFLKPIFHFIELNEDHRQLKEAVTTFVKNEIVPVAAEYDKTMEYPWPVIKKAHAAGFMNLDVPTEYGTILNFLQIFNFIIFRWFGFGLSFQCDCL